MFTEVRWTSNATSWQRRNCVSPSDCRCECDGNCHRISDKVRITNVTKIMSLTIERDVAINGDDDQYLTATTEPAQIGHNPAVTLPSSSQHNDNCSHKHSTASQRAYNSTQRDSLHLSDSIITTAAADEDAKYCLLNNKNNTNSSNGKVMSRSSTTAAYLTPSPSHQLHPNRSILYQLVMCLILNVVCNGLLITSVRADDGFSSSGSFDGDTPGSSALWDEPQTQAGHYTSTWAVHIPGGDHVAQQVADDHGYVILGKVSGFNCVLLLFHLLILI